MAVVVLPIPQDLSAWTQRTTLDGVDYQLDFAWNGRVGAWYLSISDTSGNALALGLKLVSNRPLLSRFRHISGLPAGEIFAANLAADTPYAGYTDLGQTVELTYYDAAELADIAANGP